MTCRTIMQTGVTLMPRYPFLQRIREQVTVGVFKALYRHKYGNNYFVFRQNRAIKQPALLDTLPDRN